VLLKLAYNNVYFVTTEFIMKSFLLAAFAVVCVLGMATANYGYGYPAVSGGGQSQCKL